MALKRISDSILYVGADDRTIDLFENQYPVSNGVTYNSYVIKDSKIAVMDTVDERATDQWFDNLEEAFEGKAPDYLVVSHLEPDHSGNISLDWIIHTLRLMYRKIKDLLRQKEQHLHLESMFLHL